MSDVIGLIAMDGLLTQLDQSALSAYTANNSQPVTKSAIKNLDSRISSV